MSLNQEQAAFLLDVCKLVTHATEQGFVVTGGELARTLNNRLFTSRQVVPRP